MHGRWPTSASVQQLLAGALREVSDGAFCYPILKMRVDPAEGESLLCLVAGLHERGVLESSVVAVVVCDFYAVVGSELLEGALGFNGFVGRRILHQMDESDAGKMVDKDGGAAVTAIGEFARHLREKSHLC